MHLTHEQLKAAEACGCAFVPATEEQVCRLTMQRRIFRLDGKPFVAIRNDGFYETHGTLAHLLETQLHGGAAFAQAAEAEESELSDTMADVATARTRGGAQVIRQRSGGHAAQARPRRWNR